MNERILGSITTDEFYAYADRAEARVELIEAEIVVMASPLLNHQQIALLVSVLILGLKRGLTIIAPFDVEFDTANVLQPDVIWLAPDTSAVITQRRILGAPDLMVEVLSPSTHDIDKRKKFRVYQKYGMREYWMVDSEALHLEQ